MCRYCPVNIKVVNKHHGHKPDGDRKIYIGRGSVLGNPWPISPTASRAEVIRLYEGWLNTMIGLNNQPICDALNDIAAKAASGGVDLVCFCAPQQCHGDIIKQLILNKYKEKDHVP